MDIPDDFRQFVEQMQQKRAAIIELLLHRYRAQLRGRSLQSLQDEADYNSKLERELTQEIDLSDRERPKDEMINEFVERRRRFLRSLSPWKIEEMLPLGESQ